MTCLVACLSTGKGSWTAVLKLIDSGSFEKSFLVTSDFGRENFSAQCDFVVVDSRKPIKLLVEDIKNGLKDKISDTEVALNLSSGTGKEHMAIISALLKLGLGIRFVDAAEEGIVEV